MTGYAACEQAVIERLTYHLGLEDPALCQPGNLDLLFNTMQSTGAKVGILLEYEDGKRESREPFDGNAWTWVISGIALLRFEGDAAQIEVDARNLIDKLQCSFRHHKTLSQQVAKADVTGIARPEVSKINDVPFYLIGFEVEVTERM